MKRSLCCPYFSLVICEDLLWENRALGSLLLFRHFRHGCVDWHCTSCHNPAREINKQHISALSWWKGPCADRGCLHGLNQVSIKKEGMIWSDVGIQFKLIYPLLFFQKHVSLKYSGCLFQKGKICCSSAFLLSSYLRYFQQQRFFFFLYSV